MGMPKRDEAESIEKPLASLRGKAYLKQKKDDIEKDKSPNRKGWVSSRDVVLKWEHCFWV
jgi:hypothetical protein